MARIPIQWSTNIVSPDSDYPSGRTKDKPNGTAMREETMGDFQQFFFKMLREAGITANGLPDNEYNGNQYYQALLATAQGYKSYTALMNQGSTSAPTATVMPNNTIGTIVWSRSGTGVYGGTLTGAFTANKTFANMGTLISNLKTGGSAQIIWVATNAVQIMTYDASNSPSDDVLADTPIEIRVYR